MRDKRTGWGAAELMFWSPRQLLPLLSFLTASLPFIPIVVAKLRCPRRPRGTVGECGRECRSQTDPQQNSRKVKYTEINEAHFKKQQSAGSLFFFKLHVSTFFTYKTAGIFSSGCHVGHLFLCVLHTGDLQPKNRR